MRWSRPGVAERFAAVVGAYVGPGDAPPNVSVVVGDDHGTVRTKHQLYVQGRWHAAPVDDGRLARSVARALTALIYAPGRGELLVRAVAVIGPDGRVVLVDHALDRALDAAARRLQRRGYRIIEQWPVAVDPVRAVLHLPDTMVQLGIDPASLERTFPRASADDDLQALDAPIAGLVIAAGDVPNDLVPTRAVAVTHLARLVRPEDGPLRTESVARLVPFLDAVTLVSHDTGNDGSILDAVTAALGEVDVPIRR